MFIPDSRVGLQIQFTMYNDWGILWIWSYLIKLRQGIEISKNSVYKRTMFVFAARHFTQCTSQIEDQAINSAFTLLHREEGINDAWFQAIPNHAFCYWMLSTVPTYMHCSSMCTTKRVANGFLLHLEPENDFYSM